MSLNDGTTGAVLVTSAIPNGNTTGGIDTLSELPNDLILFSNELTQTSYVFDKATGLLILTEFGDAGAVYVYDGTTGDHIAPPITPPNVRTRNNFGSSIDTLANGNLIVGDRRDYSPDRRSGAVHVFDGVTKSQLHYLPNLLTDRYSRDGFGTTVASAGNYIVVGAPDDSGFNNTGPSRSGAIYVYDGVTGSQKAYLPAATYALNAGASDDFGDAVAGSPDGTMILGSSSDSEYVLVFSFNGTHAQLTERIDTPDSTASANFGDSLAVSGSNSIVIGDRSHQPHSSGAVFLFDPSTSSDSNTFPVAVNDDSITVQEDSADNVIYVLANDSDADDDTLAIDSVNLSGTHGTTVISGNNTILFTPTADYAGTTAFSYRVTDGNGGFSVGTVTIAVSNVNDPPTSEDDYITTAEEQAVTIPVLDNDSDIDDGDVLSVHSVNVTNTAGTVTNNNNTVTFTPPTDFNGDTSFTYVTTDGDGSLSAPSSVSIIITPVNDAPVAIDDSVVTPEDTPITIPVLSNDSDVDIITAQLQAAESAAAFDAYRDLFSSLYPPVPGTINTNGVFVAYSDQRLSEIASRTSSLPVSADNATQNKLPLDDIKSEINQRDAINQLKQEKNDAQENLKVQNELLAKLITQVFADAVKQHSKGIITDQEFKTIVTNLEKQHIVLDEIKQNLSNVKDALKNAKNEIKISKEINNILDGATSGIDSRITKTISSSTDSIPVYVKTFTNYTGTQDIGVNSFVTQNDDSFTAILDESQIKSLAQSGYVSSITLPHLLEVSSVSQGVASSYANTLHNANITGSGITIAVIDDSFVLSDPKLNASSITHSALYDSVGFCGGAISCKKTQGNSHGTATAGIIADMAPDASLQLYAIASSADFENAIHDIIVRDDADIISVSLGFPTLGGDGTTGYFRDGTSSVAKAVNDAKDAGILVAVASGNDAKRHWSGTYNVSAVSPNSIGLANYTGLIEFQSDVSEARNACLPVSHGGWTVTSWDSWEYTNLDYDVFLFDGTMSNILSSSTSPQSLVAGAPIEIIRGSPVPDACIVVALSSDSDVPQDNSLIHINTIRGSIRDGLAMTQSSLTTPADARGATTVGAVNYVGNTVESFSSAGPTDDGRDKPEICGFDGVSSNQSSFNPFLGTSAAAPHVAGAAAVLMQAYPQNSTQQITNAMLASAVALSNPNLCGAGILSLQSFSDNIGINGNYTRGVTGNGPGSIEGEVNGGTEIPLITVGADSIRIQSIITPPVHGTAQITYDGTEIQYSSDLNYHGTDSFVYEITDNFGETSNATVSVDITSVNDAPFVTPIIDYAIPAQTILSFTAIAVDADESDVLTFSLPGAPAGALIDQNTGVFTWTPTESQNGRHTITIRASDAAGDFASQIFTVTVSDTTVPEIASILRSSPVDSGTSETTLVFEVVFSEPVLGVNQTDFVLSSNGTASSSVYPGMSNQTSSPGLVISDLATVSDTIHVPGSGNVTSVSVNVDITHGYIGNLLVDLVAPNGEYVTLHNRFGGSADSIHQTYTPVFGNIESGGDWILRINDNHSTDSGVLNEWTLIVNYTAVSVANPITGLEGSDNRYLVTALASQGDGTYHLVLIDDSGITDTAKNLLTNTNSTGPNQSYTVTLPDTIPPTVTAPSDVLSEATGVLTLVDTGNATATDNADPNPSVTSNTPVSFSLGNTTVTWTATDSSNNTATAIQTVTIQDTTAPTITVPPDTSFNTTGTSLSLTQADYGTATATDLVTLSPAVTSNAPASFLPGNTTITWTATDDYQNSATATQTVTVTADADTIPPTVTAPSDVLSEATGVLTLVDTGNATATDNADPNPSVTSNTPVSFSLGNTTVTWTATDSSNNTATAIQTVTIQDTTAPTITVPPDTSFNTTGTSLSLTQADYGTATATDLVTLSPAVTSNAPASFLPGNTTITWTATDDYQNSATATQTVTVTADADTIPPTVTAPSDVLSEATGVLTLVDTGNATATDNADPNPSVTSNTPVSFSLGNTTVTWTATDSSNNTATAIQTVTIQDTTAPTITVPPDTSFNTTGTSLSLTQADYGTATATDLVTLSPAVTSNAPASFLPGNTTITWTATDDYQNSATATQTVTVTADADTIPPTVTAPSDVLSEATGVLTLVDTGNATATDNADPNPSVTSNTPVSFSLGNTTVTWTATDSSNNTATAIQTVTIQDTTAPTITVPPDTSFNTTGTSLSLTQADYGTATATDLVTLSPAVTSNAPASFLPGNTTITWTATDDYQNSATATQTVTVTADADTIPPTVTAPSDVLSEATGVLTLVDTGNATATDNADPNPSVTSNTPVSFSLGNTTVTWTATDSSNNTATAIQTVTIQDTTAPTITVPPDTSFNTTGTSLSLTQADYGTATATDLVTLSPAVTSNAPASFLPGNTTITWTATDDYQKLCHCDPDGHGNCRCRHHPSDSHRTV